MSVTPTLNLYYDSTNYTPPFYWMEVVVDAVSGYQPISGPIPGPTSTSQPNELHVNVDVVSASGGSDTVVVEFGPIIVDVQNDEVHVHLIDTSESGVGGEVISLSEAQEGTRPIEV